MGSAGRRDEAVEAAASSDEGETSGGGGEYSALSDGWKSEGDRCEVSSEVGDDDDDDDSDCIST
jgi:hypothetical protein